jgi:tetratricopeptide (TPR) repeat protein/transcriptional regulator with XRE-family HTH domain
MTAGNDGGEPPGGWLRQQREKAGLSQEDLASQSGLSVRAISDLERNRTRRPHPQSVRSLTTALGLPEAVTADLIAAFRIGGYSGATGPQRPRKAAHAAPFSPPQGAEQGSVRDGASPGQGRPAAGSAGLVVPRQLPATVRHFAGRASELKALTELLDPAGEETPGTVVISAIGGTAGVGKTALAVQWAHQVADRFPDGQLYVNLRGYDPDQPMTAADALAGCLRALGVVGENIPVGADERAALYRSLLAGRRVLVVADNAAEVEQVRPLLPGTSGCVAVVTSRDPLGGLVARDGAQRLDLDLLPPEDAVGLLGVLIGQRVGADAGAAGALADRCSRLPLALRVAAELAVGRPAVPIADLVNELADQQRLLDILDAGGDSRTAVRAVFSWSLQNLDIDAIGAFGLLGLHPGNSVDRYAAAALTGTALDRAEHALGVLARAQLIQPTRPGRYGMHDLLHAYARELATAQDPEDQRREALTRLFDYYLHTAATAMDTLVPAERHRRPRVSPAASPAPPVTDPVAARAWLDTERASMVAVAGHAASEGWPGHATRLAAILFRYFEAGGHYPEGRALHTHALHAAQHCGDRAAQAGALHSLGSFDTRQGRYPQAAGQLRQALAIFREIGDRFGQVDLLNNLGITLERQGRNRQAVGQFRQALAISREIGHRNNEGQALDNLGFIERKFGSHRQAARHHEQALGLFRETGNRSSEAHALDNLGVVERMQGRYQQAADRHQQALALFRDIGELSGQAQALNGIGETLHATGRPGDAHAQHTIALSLARQIGSKLDQARAHDGLAHCHRANGDPDQARRHWQEALTLYTGLGAPEAGQVRALIATVTAAANASRELS